MYYLTWKIKAICFVNFQLFFPNGKYDWGNGFCVQQKWSRAYSRTGCSLDILAVNRYTLEMSCGLCYYVFTNIQKGCCLWNCQNENKAV